MAKITDLGVVDAITGDEFMPIVQRGATKRATMSALRALIVPYLQAWYKGDAGPTGPANSTFTTKAALRAATAANRSFLFAPDTGVSDGLLAGTFFYLQGDFSGPEYARQIAYGFIVPLTGTPLSVGALFRKDVNKGVDLDDFRLPTDTDYGPASKAASLFCSATGTTLRLVAKRYAGARINMAGTWRFECNGAEIDNFGCGKKWLAGVADAQGRVGEHMLPTPWESDAGDADESYAITMIAIDQANKGDHQIVLDTLPPADEFVTGQTIYLAGEPTPLSSIAAGKPNYIPAHDEYAVILGRTGTLVRLASPLQYTYASASQRVACYSKALAINCEATGVVTTTTTDAYQWELRSHVGCTFHITSKGSAATGATTFCDRFRIHSVTERAYGPISTARGTMTGEISGSWRRRGPNDGTPGPQEDAVFCEERVGRLTFRNFTAIGGGFSARSLENIAQDRRVISFDGCTFDARLGGRPGTTAVVAGSPFRVANALGVDFESRNTTWAGDSQLFDDQQYPGLTHAALMCHSLAVDGGTIRHSGDTFISLTSGPVYAKGTNNLARRYDDEACIYRGCYPTDDIYSFYTDWVSAAGAVAAPFTLASGSGFRRQGSFTEISAYFGVNSPPAPGAQILQLPIGFRGMMEEYFAAAAAVSADTTFPTGQTTIISRPNGGIYAGDMTGKKSVSIKIRISANA